MDALSHSGISCNISTGLRICIHDFRCAESPSNSSSPISIHSLTNHPPLQGFVSGITNCATQISAKYFILVQLIVFLPLALIRDLAKLSTTALIADAFILVGLIYMFGSEFKVIAERGIADVKLFNPKDFALFVGYAIVSHDLLLHPLYDMNFLFLEPPYFHLKESAWYVMT